MVTTTAPSPEVINSSSRRYRIPGDQVKRAISELPAEQRADIWWFHCWCSQHDVGNTELGRILRRPGTNEYYSQDSIKQLLNGGRTRRGETVDPIHEAIVGFRKIEDARAEQATSGFIETRLFREIEKRCLKALHRQKILPLFGDSQIGKSTCLEEVQRRHNHGQTILIEVPTGGAQGSLIRRFAEKFSIPASTKQADLKDRIFSAIDGNMLIILDEAHRFFEGRQGSAGVQSLSFVRELYNRCKCGIVLSMTNEGRDHMLNGKHAKALQ